MLEHQRTQTLLGRLKTLSIAPAAVALRVLQQQRRDAAPLLPTLEFSPHDADFRRQLHSFGLTSVLEETILSAYVVHLSRLQAAVVSRLDGAIDDTILALTRLRGCVSLEEFRRQESSQWPAVAAAFQALYRRHEDLLQQKVLRKVRERRAFVCEARHRGPFNSYATMALQGIFDANDHPNQAEVELIAELLGVKTKQVSTWFSNRRSRKPPVKSVASKRKPLNEIQPSIRPSKKARMSTQQPAPLTREPLATVASTADVAHRLDASLSASSGQDAGVPIHQESHPQGAGRQEDRDVDRSSRLDDAAVLPHPTSAAQIGLGLPSTHPRRLNVSLPMASFYPPQSVATSFGSASFDSPSSSGLSSDAEVALTERVASGASISSSISSFISVSSFSSSASSEFGGEDSGPRTLWALIVSDPASYLSIFPAPPSVASHQPTFVLPTPIDEVQLTFVPEPEYYVSLISGRPVVEDAISSQQHPWSRLTHPSVSGWFPTELESDSSLALDLLPAELDDIFDSFEASGGGSGFDFPLSVEEGRGTSDFVFDECEDDHQDSSEVYSFL